MNLLNLKYRFTSRKHWVQTTVYIIFLTNMLEYTYSISFDILTPESSSKNNLKFTVPSAPIIILESGESLLSNSANSSATSKATIVSILKENSPSSQKILTTFKREIQKNSSKAVIVVDHNEPYTQNLNKALQSALNYNKKGIARAMENYLDYIVKKNIPTIEPTSNKNLNVKAKNIMKYTPKTKEGKAALKELQEALMAKAKIKKIKFTGNLPYTYLKVGEQLFVIGICELNDTRSYYVLNMGDFMVKEIKKITHKTK